MFRQASHTASCLSSSQQQTGIETGSDKRKHERNLKSSMRYPQLRDDSSTEIYGIEDEKGLFVPSISLEEKDKARGLIFCMGGHIVTLTGVTEGIVKFRFKS